MHIFFSLLSQVFDDSIHLQTEAICYFFVQGWPGKMDQNPHSRWIYILVHICSYYMLIVLHAPSGAQKMPKGSGGKMSKHPCSSDSNMWPPNHIIMTRNFCSDHDHFIIQWIQTQQYWQLLIWTYIEKGPNWIPQNAICCNNVMLLNITYPQTCYLMLESWKQTQFYPGLVAQQSLLYKNVHVLLISRLFWSWTTESKMFSSKKKNTKTPCSLLKDLASFHGCVVDVPWLH
jgi:hypothetical protein